MEEAKKKKNDERDPWFKTILLASQHWHLCQYCISDNQISHCVLQCNQLLRYKTPLIMEVCSLCLCWWEDKLGGALQICWKRGGHALSIDGEGKDKQKLLLDLFPWPFLCAKPKNSSETVYFYAWGNRLRGLSFCNSAGCTGVFTSLKWK